MSEKNRVLRLERLRLKRMAKFASDRAVVADVGFRQCANPFLTADQVIGIDPNSVADDKVYNYSEVFSGTLADYISEKGAEAFDVVLAGELIEHLETPVDFLRQCYASLKPGGRVVLSTPNPISPIECFLTLILSRRYFYTNEHVILIPQRWLIRIMEMAGFTNVKLYSGGFPLPIVGLIPFPRTWCYQTIAIGDKALENTN